MGLFSKRKEVTLPEISALEREELELCIEIVSQSAGDLLRAIVSNVALTTYITKTLAPKLVKPAMMQDFAGVALVLKADPVVGPLADIAYKAFNEGYANV